MRRAALVLLVLIAGAAAWLASRNPEHLTLDAAARAGVAGRFIRLDDGVTHVEEAGPDTGVRVILVHGFSVPGYIWDSTYTALAAAGFRVARYDTYGRGWSDRPDADFTLDLFDRQLAGVLDSLGWNGPVHLIGLSFGGPVTGTFVSRHPARVRSHVLIDPAAGTSRTLPWYVAAPVIGPLIWQALVVPGMADGQASDFVHPERWPDWADRYRVQVQYRGFGESIRRTSIAMQTLRYDSVYASAAVAAKPTLLIWGEQDQTVTIDKADGVRRAIPQTEFHAIPNAGHLPHIERADVVRPLLERWLRLH